MNLTFQHRANLFILTKHFHDKQYRISSLVALVKICSAKSRKLTMLGIGRQQWAITLRNVMEARVTELPRQDENWFSRPDCLFQKNKPLVLAASLLVQTLQHEKSNKPRLWRMWHRVYRTWQLSRKTKLIILRRKWTENWMSLCIFLNLKCSNKERAWITKHVSLI